MDIRSSQEALYIAVEMERRAISFYERADMVFSDSKLSPTIRQLWQDEQAHLARFEALLDGQQPPDEQGLLLSAEADGLLFAGGLLAAARQGAFNSRGDLIAYAAAQEEGAVTGYLAFADQCQGEAREAFLSIAREETQHLSTLRQMLQPGKNV